MKKLLVLVLAFGIITMATETTFAYLAADFNGATCQIKDKNTLTVRYMNFQSYGGLRVDFQWDPNYYVLIPVGAWYESTSPGGAPSGCSAPSVSGLTFPSTVAVSQTFCISYNYSDPDGLSDVKEHHILMSDGTNAVYSAQGSGQFNVCSFYFDSPGTYTIQVYVVDSCGKQSNAPSGSIAVTGFSGFGCQSDGHGGIICINSVNESNHPAAVHGERPKKQF